MNVAAQIHRLPSSPPRCHRGCPHGRKRQRRALAPPSRNPSVVVRGRETPRVILMHVREEDRIELSDRYADLR
jgi:hypothetical protein